MKTGEQSGRKAAIQEILKMISDELDGRLPQGEKSPIAKVEVIKVKAKPVDMDSEHEMEEDSETPERDWDCSCKDGKCGYCMAMQEMKE